MQRIRVKARQLGDRHFLISFSSRVGVITQSLLRAGKGGRMARVKAGYFGFDKFDDAQAFAGSVSRRYPKARLWVRTGKRLATAFEVKVSHDAVESLAWEMAKRTPTTSQRIEQHIQQHSRFIDRAEAPVMNRTTNRKTMTGRAGICVGID